MTGLLGLQNSLNHQGGCMGCGFCKYDITTAEIDNIKLLSICFVSSDDRELEKLIKAQ